MASNNGDGCKCLDCPERECTCPHAWVAVTLTLPLPTEPELPATNLPTVAGKWERLPDGRILATYAPHELKSAVDVVKALMSANGVEAHGLRKNNGGG